MDKKLTKGLIAGGIIGGLVASLFMTKKGKQIRQQAMDYAEDLYDEMRKRAGELSELSWDKLEEVAKTVVKEYGKKKAWAVDVQEDIVEGIKERWLSFKADELFDKVKAEYAEAKQQTKENFTRIAEDIVSAYAEEKKIGARAKNQLMRELRKRYADLADEISG